MAWETRKDPVEMTVPAAAHTPAVTTALANITELRAGTATVVVRIRPLLYSLVTVMAPRLPAMSISVM
jgi:hypothetical protein